ncbi:MAG TPA: type II CAAX endopeptidase family protein [Clostridiales bacterium]|nr:type II CAAX endopeptidase family protein [Clostridiales bacterium]HOL90917.1 type II CAAX endopeptidase family protein [Clostridiales bacterium]HPP34720.1 type II CAAX endopeptidase family protein [Clostridiales bacterium]
MIDSGEKATAALAGENVKKLRPGVDGACVLFSVVIILFVLLGYRIQSREFYSGILITEFMLILLPALVFAAISGVRFKEALRLDKFRPVNIPIVIGIMIFAIPVATLLNVLNLLAVDSIFGKTVMTSLPAAENGVQLLVNILVIAGSAGICEEVLFRGVLQRSFERFGTAGSILLAALLFSLTHLDFQKILGTFALGALIGYIVYRTNSLYCGMLAHFTNNATAVFASYISGKMLEAFQLSDRMPSGPADISALFDTFAALPVEQKMIIFMVYGFVFLFVAIVLTLLVYSLTRANRVSPVTMPHGSGLSYGTPAQGKAKGLLWLLPGIILILLWFYVQANGFLGIQNAVTEAFRLLIGAV